MFEESQWLFPGRKIWLPDMIITESVVYMLQIWHHCFRTF